MDYCLGVEFLGKCSDYVNYELSVFNIGVFMAVIGVFFAGSQLISSVHKIRYKVRYANYIWFLLLTPLITTIVGTLLPFIPGEPLPVVGYSIFWEIFTAIFIIILGLILIPTLFFRKISSFDNVDGKLNSLYISYIARNKDVDVLVDELGYFFDSFLIKLKEELDKNEWGYAHQFINIIQGQRFIEKLIESPATMQSIITSFHNDKRSQFSYEEQKFLGKMILDSFANNNSFLVHELDGNFNIDFRNNNGIILRRIIEDLDFLGKLNLLGEFNTFGYSANPNFAKNCLKFTLKIHEEFVKRDKIDINYLKYDLLLKVFETQEGIIRASFKEIDPLLMHDIIGSHFKHSLGELKDSLLKLYPSNKFPEIVLNKKKPYGGEYHYHDSNVSVLDAYAFGIYKLLSAFAQYKDEEIRFYTLNFSSSLGENAVFKEVEKRLFLLYKYKINDNLVGYYPMISRVFWENYFWNILCKTEEVNKNNDIMEIIKIYAEKLPKLSQGYIYAYTKDTLDDPYGKEMAIKKANKIIKDLFPDYIEYDRKNNSLSIYDRDRLSYNVLDLQKTLSSGKIEITTSS